MQSIIDPGVIDRVAQNSKKKTHKSNTSPSNTLNPGKPTVIRSMSKERRVSTREKKNMTTNRNAKSTFDEISISETIAGGSSMMLLRSIMAVTTQSTLPAHSTLVLLVSLVKVIARPD